MQSRKQHILDCTVRGKASHSPQNLRTLAQCDDADPSWSHEGATHEDSANVFRGVICTAVWKLGMFQRKRRELGMLGCVAADSPGRQSSIRSAKSSSIGGRPYSLISKLSIAFGTGLPGYCSRQASAKRLASLTLRLPQYFIR